MSKEKRSSSISMKLSSTHIPDTVSGSAKNFCITALHDYLGMFKALCASRK